MINKWLVAVLFLAVMFIDGIFFPGVFGFKESFLTIIFIVLMLLYYNVNLQSLVFGMALSGLAEFYWGLDMGTLILSFLVSAGALVLLNKFFNIQSRVFVVISGIIIFAVFWETSVLVANIL